MARSGKVRVLVVDDDHNRGQQFQRCLSDEFEISLAQSQEAARKILDSQEFDVLVGANDVDRVPVKTNSVSPANSDNSRKDGAALLGLVEAGQGIFEPKTPQAKSALINIVTEVIDSGRSLDSAMAEIEAAVIRAALKEQRGNRSAAARQLQLPRQTLQDRMKKHGLWSA